jgi:hypothetical protein
MGIDWEIACDPPLVRASVIIKGVETIYDRAGVGRPVLVLAVDASLRFRTASALVPAARVIVPELRTDEAGGAWLHGLLDGLGVDGVGIVADEVWAVAALELALIDPWRVDRLAILHRPGTSGFLPPDGLEESLESAGQRLLLIEVGGAEGWTRRIAGFMRA